MKKGIFYAVGVGSGDPMDMTLKARDILEKADVIIIPVKKKGKCSIAYQIAVQAANMEQAEKIEIVFPMKPKMDYRENLRNEAMQSIYQALDAGKTVAMVTLGDVSVYSTATYVRQILKMNGYETKVVAGIPSFCSGAAKAQQSLCENGESLMVMPGVISKESVDSTLERFDNILIMKAGKAMKWLIPLLESRGLLNNTIMFQNVGMQNEYIGTPKNGEQSYFTTLLIKKGGLL